VTLTLVGRGYECNPPGYGQTFRSTGGKPQRRSWSVRGKQGAAVLTLNYATAKFRCGGPTKPTLGETRVTVFAEKSAVNVSRSSTMAGGGME